MSIFSEMMEDNPITRDDKFWEIKFGQAMELWESSESLQQSCPTYLDLVMKLPSFREEGEPEQNKIKELYNEWLLVVF